MITFKIFNNYLGWFINEYAFHNNNGPAVIWHDGERHWRVYGKLHRLDGPAIECSDGYKSYWINDNSLPTEFEYWLAVQNYDTI